MPLPSPTSACAAAGRARGCARCSPRTGFTRATSSGRCSSATAAIARSRSPRFRASADGASTASAPRRSEAAALGIPCIALFPNTPEHLRTEDAREEALNSDNLICRAIKAIKDAAPEIGVLTDVALDPYTATATTASSTSPATSSTTTRSSILVEQALVQAEAGADIVAPSDMMDGRVAAIREALEREGHQNVAIMAYAAKYASAFYGPFRDAVGSRGPAEGRQARLPDGPGQHRGGAARG